MIFLKKINAVNYTYFIFFVCSDRLVTEENFQF